MIHVHELQQIIKDDMTKFLRNLGSESVDLLDSVGRVLATDIVSPLDIPPAAVSAMDGYAMMIDVDELGASERLQFIGESIAGKPFTGKVETRQCLRIMTGAVVPDDVNTVIMQEYVERDGEIVTLTKSAKRGSNIRKRGEEVTNGEVVLKAGHIICETDIPLLASLGNKTVSVFWRLRVGVLSTGDELRELGESLAIGQIYDSNRMTIKALLRNYPVIINDYGIVKDDLETIKATLNKVANENDFIVTSGGVSVGDYDFLKDAVDELGDIVQYKVAMKPGKPFVYGTVKNAHYFGLPGNPLSTAISARLFMLPAIYQCFTQSPPALQFQAKLTTPTKRKSNRAELQRGIAEKTATGQWQVRTEKSQDSHRVSQFSRANVLVYLSADEGEKAVGELVNVLPLNGKFI